MCVFTVKKEKKWNFSNLIQSFVKMSSNFWIYLNCWVTVKKKKSLSAGRRKSDVTEQIVRCSQEAGSAPTWKVFLCIFLSALVFCSFLSFMTSSAVVQLVAVVCFLCLFSAFTVQEHDDDYYIIIIIWFLLLYIIIVLSWKTVRSLCCRVAFCTL